MAKPKKDNRVKRKRGKKFVYLGDKQQAENQQKQAEESNPFEDHTKSKRARKDAEVREDLLSEFKNRGRTSEFVDRRIGEKSSKMTEEDRYSLFLVTEQVIYEFLEERPMATLVIATDMNMAYAEIVGIEANTH